MKKLSKKLLLASLGFAAATITVPVVLTSCADGKKGDETPPPKTVELKTTDTFTYVGSINDLFKDDGTTMSVAQMLTSKIQTSEELKKEIIINNSELSSDQFKSLNFEVTSNNNDAWVGTDNQPTGLQEVYYDITSSQLTISSLKDLQNQLTPEFLAKAFEEAGIKTENATYKLADNTKLNFNKDNNYIGVTVDENVADTLATKALKQYNLIIPVSDLNVEFKDAKISVTSNLNTVVNVTDRNIDVKFDLGIESKSMFDTTKEIDLNYQQKTTLNVLKTLGWVKDKDQTNYDLNSEKVGEDIKIFNTTFTIDENGLSTNSNGKYDLTLKATPNSGYSWTDGTNSEKTIVISDLNIVKGVEPGVTTDAKIPALDEATQVNADISSETITVESDDLNTYFADAKNLKLVTDKLTEDKGFANVSFVFKSQETKENNYVLTLTATPNETHAWDDGTNDGKEVKVLASFNFKTAVVSTTSTYGGLNTSESYYVNGELGLDNLKKYVTDKNLIDTIKSKVEADLTSEGKYTNVKELTTSVDKITKDGEKYQIELIAKAKDGYLFTTSGTDTETIVVELTNISWSQLGASVVEETPTIEASSIASIGDYFKNSDVSDAKFQEWFNVAENKTALINQLKEQAQLTNASIDESTVKAQVIETDGDTKGKVTITATVKADAGYVFENGVKPEKTLTATLQGIQWVSYIAEPTNLAYGQQIVIEIDDANASSKDQLISALKSGTDYDNIKKQLTQSFADNLESFTLKEDSVTIDDKAAGTLTDTKVEYTITLKDGYSFGQGKGRTQPFTVTINSIDVKRNDAKVDTSTPFSFDDVFTLVTDGEVDETSVKNALDKNDTIKNKIYDLVKAKSTNVKENGFSLSGVTGNTTDGFVAQISVEALDGHYFGDVTNKPASMTVNVKITKATYYKKANKKSSFEYTKDVIIGTTGTDPLISYDEFKSYLEIGTNKQDLQNDILTELLKDSSFSNIKEVLITGTKLSNTASLYSIEVKIVADDNYAFEDGNTETVISLMFSNLKRS